MLKTLSIPRDLGDVMKNIFFCVSIFCCNLLVGAPADFIALLKQSALQTLQTEPALQSINQAAVTTCINSLFDTGYAELTNDPNHTIADITLGIIEKTFGDLARQGQIGSILCNYLHALPDQSLRINGYTPNLSSLALTEEKTIALNWRAAAVESMLGAPNAWVYPFYSKSDFDTFQADPANQVQIQNFHSVLSHHPQMRADVFESTPPEDLEGVLYKVRSNEGIFFTFTTNIPDRLSETPMKLKFWILFPYKNPNANKSEQSSGAAHASSMQQFLGSAQPS